MILNKSKILFEVVDHSQLWLPLEHPVCGTSRNGSTLKPIDISIFLHRSISKSAFWKLLIFSKGVFWKSLVSSTGASAKELSEHLYFLHRSIARGAFWTNIFFSKWVYREELLWLLSLSWLAAREESSQTCKSDYLTNLTIMLLYEM